MRLTDHCWIGLLFLAQCSAEEPYGAQQNSAYRSLAYAESFIGSIYQLPL